MCWYRWDGEDLILQIQISSRASRDELARVVGDYLKIRITSPPVEGRANAHLISFLAKQFGTAKGHVTLLQGEKSKTKLIRIQAPTKIPTGIGITKPQVREA